MLSRQAQIIERIMKRLNLKELSNNSALVSLQKNITFQEPNPSFRLKYPVEVYRIRKYKCVYATSAKNSTPLCHIIYFHGGSYTYPAQRAHWHIIDSILSRVNVEVTFVNYPLAPEHNCSEAIEISYLAYKNVVENYNDNIVLMGDSAGGGLALALAQYINKKNKKIKPKKIVLMSPWLDISMDIDIPEDLADRDLILDKDVLKAQGAKYAGDMDTHNYLCSPLYGRMKNLGDVAVFTGTNDILSIQAEELKKHMEKHNLPLTFYEYTGMHHVWMGYPIPEAKNAFDEIAEFLKS